ncbi:MAG: AAA family ATPase [Syntrophobacteraceae bacterium]
MIQNTIQEVKTLPIFRGVFQELYPDHYRETGNCRCPFHADSNPSFQVDDFKGFCHSPDCPVGQFGKTLDVIDLWKLTFDCSTEEAVQALSLKYGTGSGGTVEQLTGCTLQNTVSGKEKKEWGQIYAQVSREPELQQVEYLKSRHLLDALTLLFERDLARSAADKLAFPLFSWNVSESKLEWAGIQYIRCADNGKSYEPGSVAKEAFFWIGGAEPYVICEGIADAISAAIALPGRGVVSILSANLTGKLAPFRSLQPPILFFDNDPAGEAATRETINVLRGHCRVVDWKIAPKGFKDVNDLLVAGHGSVIREMIERSRKATCRREYTAQELMQMDFQEPSWVIPGILPQGLGLLVGRAKTGKSWMVLDIGIAAPSGGMALDQVRVEKGDVLYLALEDNERRMKSRLMSLLGGNPAPAALNIRFEWPRMDQGGMDRLEEWLKEHAGTKLVIIDTLAKVWPRKKAGNNENIYHSDYEAVASLKTIADRYQIAILVVHHERKALSEDPLDQVSGSTGIAGAADTILILQKARGRADATLLVTGRDVEEQNLALEFDKESKRWRMLGKADEFTRSRERQKIIELLRGSEKPLSPKEVATSLRKNGSTTRGLMNKMLDDGELWQPESGKYLVKGDNQ